jgi:hypothetical protein
LAAQYDNSASNRYWYIQQKTFSSGNDFGVYPTASTTAGRINSESTFTPSTGTWYHITALYDPSAGEQRLYIDGALADTDVSTGFQSSTIGLSLGSLDGVQNWNGKLDDVRQYSRALTQAEITHLASQRGIEGPPPEGLGDEQLWLCPSIANTANDISGNGNNGTYQGGMGTVADTSEGGTRAYDFNGAGDYIDIQGLSGQYPLGGSYSTSLWVNNDVTNIDQLYFNRYETDGASGSNDQRPEILMSDDTGLRTRVLYKVGTGTLGLNVNSTYQGSVWYHIASTYDSATNTMTLYKNGVSVGSVVTAVDSDWETNYAEIGRASISGGASQSYSDCKLDDIRSFTRVLTQAEITHLATSRGIEGGPSSGGFYNPFINKTFNQNYTNRIG